MAPALIEVQNLTKTFDGNPVLEEVSFRLHEGQVLAIIGKSGVGKSVLLKHIVGLMRPDAGRVLFKGQPVDRMGPGQTDAYLERISYMFQNNALFSSLTVHENVALPLRRNRAIDRRQADKRVRAQLEQMELRDAAEKFPGELSGGMQKRVALARALVSEPDIVLFDEPTSGQDPIRKNAILSMIAAHQQRHKFSAILISHDLPDVFFISNVILALYEGRVIFEGPPEEFEQFDHPFRTEFVHSLELLQRELTGLYSRRQFKMRYLSDLVRKPEEVAYTAAIFTIEDMPGVAAALGHSAAQELVATMGTFISKHFSDVGGFSTRYSMEAFVTVLPFAKVEETRRLIDNFRDDLTASGIPRMKRIRPAETACVDPVGITLAVGLAQGRPQTELGAVIASAVANQEHLARFNVICRGGSQP
ncbi:MAG: ATP-binding cassette domain-containing protein [Desulfobacterales bacterium]|jgi:phospholipid/cholesterol/gamma-HCH transport system ATP-binding protein